MPTCRSWPRWASEGGAVCPRLGIRVSSCGEWYGPAHNTVPRCQGLSALLYPCLELLRSLLQKESRKARFCRGCCLILPISDWADGVDRGQTAKQGVPDGLGADIGEKAGCGEAGRLVYDMEDGHGVDAHDIHHDPLIESRILDTKGDAEVSRPRLDWLAGIIALRYILKDLEHLRGRLFGAGLP